MPEQKKLGEVIPWSSPNKRNKSGTIIAVEDPVIEHGLLIHRYRVRLDNDGWECGYSESFTSY